MMKTKKRPNQEQDISINHLALIFVFSLIGFTPGFSANRINIPQDYPTIQQGISAAQNGDTVLVHPGTYDENINFNGKNIVVASLYITTDNIDSMWSYLVNTIISGNNNGCVVTFKNGEDSTAKLIGFHLMNGAGSGQFPNINGGGITCWNNSNPSIISNMISGCSSSYGGGFFFYNSSPIVTGCSFDYNNASGSGGGGVCYNSNATFFNNVAFIQNTCTNYNGGGLYLYASDIVLNNVKIMQNTGVYGGGVQMWASSPHFNDCSILNNQGTNCGGGVHIYSGSNPVFTNTLIANNVSDNEGGGVSCENNSSPLFRNVTIANNTASTIGGGISCYGNINLTIVNSIIWGNQNKNISFWASGTSNTISIAYSDLQDSLLGIQTNDNGTVNWLDGNISDDPLFTDSGNDFNLMENSPCIDAGIANLKINGKTIIELTGREYNNAAPDMGALESKYITEWINYSTSNSDLPGNSVTAIKLDKSGRIWVGTGNGLARYFNGKWTVFNTSNSGLPVNDIRSINSDNDENIWIGTYNGGLVKYSINENTWTVFNTTNSNCPSNYIMDLEVDTDNNIVVGTYRGGLGIFNQKTQSWTVYNSGNSSLSSGFINSIWIDYKNKIWIGTGGGGLFCLDNENWIVYTCTSMFLQ